MADLVFAVVVLAVVAYLVRRLAGHWLVLLTKDLIVALAWLARLLFLGVRTLIRFVAEEVRS